MLIHGIPIDLNQPARTLLFDLYHPDGFVYIVLRVSWHNKNSSKLFYKFKLFFFHLINDERSEIQLKFIKISLVILKLYYTIVDY